MCPIGSARRDATNHRRWICLVCLVITYGWHDLQSLSMYCVGCCLEYFLLLIARSTRYSTGDDVYCTDRRGYPRRPTYLRYLSSVSATEKLLNPADLPLTHRNKSFRLGIPNQIKNRTDCDQVDGWTCFIVHRIMT